MVSCPTFFFSYGRIQQNFFLIVCILLTECRLMPSNYCANGLTLSKTKQCASATCTRGECCILQWWCFCGPSPLCFANIYVCKSGIYGVNRAIFRFFIYFITLLTYIYLLFLQAIRCAKSYCNYRMEHERWCCVGCWNCSLVITLLQWRNHSTILYVGCCK